MYIQYGNALYVLIYSGKLKYRWPFIEAPPNTTITQMQRTPGRTVLRQCWDLILWYTFIGKWMKEDTYTMYQRGVDEGQGGCENKDDEERNKKDEDGKVYSIWRQRHQDKEFDFEEERQRIGRFRHRCWFVFVLVSVFVFDLSKVTFHEVSHHSVELVTLLSCVESFVAQVRFFFSCLLCWHNKVGKI